MKKLIFLLLFPLGLFGQEFNEAVHIAIDDTITADTYYWVKLDQNVKWRLTVTYSGNTDTTTTIVPMTKSTTYGTPSICAGFSAQAATASSTTVSFVDTDSLDEWIGIFVNVASGATIINNIWYYFSKR